MSTESLFGGSVDLETAINAESIALLNAFLMDTVPSSLIRLSFDNSVLIVASGDNGQKHGALLPLPGDAVQGTFNDGVIRLDLQLPASVGMLFEGMDNVTPAVVGNYLLGVIDTYLPPGVNDNERSSLINVVNDLMDALEGMGAQVAVRLVEFLGSNGVTVQQGVPDGAAAAVGASTEVIFDGAGTGAETLFAFNLSNLADSNTLVLRNVNNVAVAGSGSVRVDGTVGAFITSNAASQSITGGAGNDTLMGGGGSDTLTGGAGADLFGFDFANNVGNYTITDFDLAQDRIAVDMANIMDVGQLVASVRAISQTAMGVTYYFDNNASVTLVGINASQLTAGMIEFDI